MNGLTATFVEAPLFIQQSLQFPEEMTQQCLSQNIPIKGNATYHSKSTEGWLNLTGERSIPIMMDDSGMMGGMSTGMPTASGVAGAMSSEASRINRIIAL